MVVELWSQQVVVVGDGEHRADQADDVVVTGDVRAKRRRCAVVVAGPHVDSGGEQQLDDVELSFNCGVVQRRPAVPVPDPPLACIVTFLHRRHTIILNTQYTDTQAVTET